MKRKPHRVGPVKIRLTGYGRDHDRSGHPRAPPLEFGVIQNRKRRVGRRAMFVGVVNSLRERGCIIGRAD